MLQEDYPPRAALDEGAYDGETARAAFEAMVGLGELLRPHDQASYIDTISGFEYFADPANGIAKFCGTANGDLPGALDRTVRSTGFSECSHDHYQCELGWRHWDFLDLQSRLQAGW